jgi:hypothetical protein
MTREYLKSQIDSLPESAFTTLAAMFAPFLDYVTLDRKDDPFYSEANQAWLSESMKQFEDGTPLIMKTFEELKAYED